MRKIIGTTSETLIPAQGYPVDIMVQNISANIVYISFSPIDDINQNGVKILAGETWFSDKLRNTVYVAASAASTEIRYEVQSL